MVNSSSFRRSPSAIKKNIFFVYTATGENDFAQTTWARSYGTSLCFFCSVLSRQGDPGALLCMHIVCKPLEPVFTHFNLSQIKIALLQANVEAIDL